MKKYYEDNKESILASAQLKYAEDPQHQKDLSKQSYSNNPEAKRFASKQASKLAYEQDPDPKKIAAKQGYKKNPEQKKKASKKR